MHVFRFLVLVLGLVLVQAPAVAQLKSQQFYGSSSDTHPYVLYLTWDDLMDEVSLTDGTYQTLEVAKVVASLGLPAAFFLVGCHMDGQGYALGLSSQCVSLGDVPMSVARQLTDGGFLVGNHTFSHVSLNYLSDSQAADEVRKTKVIIDGLGQTLGLNLLRCPGMNCGGNVTALNLQSDLKNLRGPMNADIGGGFYTDAIQPVPGITPGVATGGGDWWFYLSSLPPELAGYYYVRDILALGSRSGLIILLHTRSEVMIGRDGSRQFPVKLITYILAHLPPQFTFAPLDGIPGLLGNIQTTAPELISHEFGSNDGQGRVVAGDVDGDGKIDFCKARGNAISCITRTQTQPRLQNRQSLMGASASWYQVSDVDWSAKFESKFWLADINNDGRADLILPSKLGLMVSYSDGQEFSAPVPAVLGNFDHRGISFADLNHDGWTDIVVWTPSAVLSYINDGHGGFKLPLQATLDFPNLSAMQVADLNYDGCPDLIVRGVTDVLLGLGDCQGHFLPAQSWSKRFSDRQNFALPSQSQTFCVTKINGYTGVAAGLFTGGIVFQQSNLNGRAGQYRYLMDNHGYSGDPQFHPQAYASDLVFADLYNDGNTAPIQVRVNGLYASRIK